MRHLRASDSNQYQRGQNTTERTNSSDWGSGNAGRRGQSSRDDSSTSTMTEAVDVVKDKMGNIVHKVEDMASAAWSKISGAASDATSTAKGKMDDLSGGNSGERYDSSTSTWRSKESSKNSSSSSSKDRK